jgi:hypothetical protein
MKQLPHLFPESTGTTRAYIYPKDPHHSFQVPPRDPTIHARTLLEQFERAEQAARRGETGPASVSASGMVLEFESAPQFALNLDSLENQRAGIELRNARIDDSRVMRATVFVPNGELKAFVRKVQDFSDPQKNAPSGKPANNSLVASISQVRLAAIEAFWTDAAEFPNDHAKAVWWEVWLQNQAGESDVVSLFSSRARAVGTLVSKRSLRFPDRSVVLLNASITQLLQIENLCDMLAELRAVRIPVTEFIELAPRDQMELAEELLQRIQPPKLNAPAVCHLDTGVNRGHPLLEMALADEHLLAVDPTWSTADRHPQQHGTGMAGLALYGCLTGVLNETGRVVLQHRLESVKILSEHSHHDPDLYGEVTKQAVSRIEIVAPDRPQRVFSLTVTASECRDEGTPSSWSAALDQICSGSEEADRPSRLLIVSAGNTPITDRHEYPAVNDLHGVEDPAQSWNAVCVGAYTEKTAIRSDVYADWRPLAGTGQLSPGSRTSMIWSDKSWPVKPDIVMEGGNLAIDPTTGRADYIDDLMLLTTQTGQNGAMFTTTADTSAATSLAARYAAMIWAQYPGLSAESVRGLLVHSARWTKPMLKEFPRNKRRQRLRVYGYGVPDLRLALWSAGHHTTMVIEDELQPFESSAESTNVKAKDLRLHQLPWPKDVLEQLGEDSVSLRVTLSYFIEPSPGRAGWKTKHQYQSHGLRFDIKRPTDGSEREFLQRITKSAWNEDQQKVSSSSDTRKWELGQKLRNLGSVHSDVWKGSAAQLAAAGMIAVYPVSGWWRNRPKQSRGNRSARYSLILSLETAAIEADLYTPIANQIGVPIPAT